MKSSRYLGPPLLGNSQGKAHVQRTLRLFTAHGIFPVARVSTMCSPVPGPLQGATVLLSGSVSLHGLCPTDRSREPARHRNLPSSTTAQTVPCRHSRQRFADHLGPGQRKPRLAHLCRICPCAHPPRANVVRPRRLWSPTRPDRLGLRFQHHRSVSFPVSMSPLSSAQSRDQAAHLDGSAR